MLVLPNDLVILAVGDESGHGVTVAASMGQLRSGLAGLALTTSEPAALLDGAQRFIQHLGNPLVATLALVVLDPATGLLTFACAGHRPPMVAARAGHVVTLWQGRSPMLGYPYRQTCPQGRHVLDVDDTLLLYTDELIESRREIIDGGFARLAAEAGALAEIPIDDFCSTLAHAMLGDRPHLDDVAVLALRRERMAGDHPGRPPNGGPPHHAAATQNSVSTRSPGAWVMVPVGTVRQRPLTLHPISRQRDRRIHTMRKMDPAIAMANTRRNMV